MTFWRRRPLGLGSRCLQRSPFSSDVFPRPLLDPLSILSFTLAFYPISLFPSLIVPSLDLAPGSHSRRGSMDRCYTVEGLSPT